MTDKVVVAITYPVAYEVRPREELDRDLDALRAMDPRIEVIADVRYVDTDEVRVAKGGAPPHDHLRALEPELTPEQLDMFAHVEIVLAQDLPLDVAKIAPNLRFVQGLGAGVSQLVSAGLGDAGIRLASAAGVNAVAISEFVIGRVLQVWKRFREIEELQVQHQWVGTYGLELSGATVGVIGLGAIGSAVARRVRAFDVHVIASRNSYRPGMTAPDVDELCGPTDLHSMLGRSDVVVAAVPESAGTIDVMDEAAFAAMKPGAVFCNVGRGSFVVEEALVAALESGHLGAAILDVTRLEPLPADSPLWDAPNLYLSPHSSSSAVRFFPNLHAIFRENVRRYLAGEPLRNEADLTRGY
jgi:phosphoglycerate dehydrogenase-like enzyme